MVWGYGRIGYGPFRTAQVLEGNPHASSTLLEVARKTKQDGGPAAFEYLSRNRLRDLGVAFATKYLFFCSAGSATTPALVLDRLVRDWLADNAGWRINLNWRVSAYEEYVQTASAWASELGLQPAEVEYLMFNDRVSADPMSQWAPTAGGVIVSPPPPGPGRTASANRRGHSGPRGARGGCGCLRRAADRGRSARCRGLRAGPPAVAPDSAGPGQFPTSGA